MAKMNNGSVSSVAFQVVKLMLVLINDMPRSGSTFSFNVVRDILTRRGSVTWFAADQVELGVLESGTENVIVKSHNPNALGIRLVQTGAMKGIALRQGCKLFERY